MGNSTISRPSSRRRSRYRPLVSGPFARDQLRRVVTRGTLDLPMRRPALKLDEVSALEVGGEVRCRQDHAPIEVVHASGFRNRSRPPRRAPGLARHFIQLAQREGRSSSRRYGLANREGFWREDGHPHAYAGFVRHRKDAQARAGDPRSTRSRPLGCRCALITRIMPKAPATKLRRASLLCPESRVILVSGSISHPRNAKGWHVVDVAACWKHAAEESDDARWRAGNAIVPSSRWWMLSRSTPWAFPDHPF